MCVSAGLPALPLLSALEAKGPRCQRGGVLRSRRRVAVFSPCPDLGFLCARLCPSLDTRDQPTLTTSSLHDHLVKRPYHQVRSPAEGLGVRASTYEV